MNRKELMHNKSFTVIPMEKLDEVRLILRGKLKELERTSGERYTIRTFFLGPRPKHNGSSYIRSRPASTRSTRKSVATGAKIGIYKFKAGCNGRVWPELNRYV